MCHVDLGGGDLCGHWSVCNAVMRYCTPEMSLLLSVLSSCPYLHVAVETINQTAMNELHRVEQHLLVASRLGHSQITKLPL